MKRLTSYLTWKQQDFLRCTMIWFRLLLQKCIKVILLSSLTNSSIQVTTCQPLRQNWLVSRIIMSVMQNQSNKSFKCFKISVKTLFWLLTMQPLTLALWMLTTNVMICQLSHSQLLIHLNWHETFTQNTNVMVWDRWPNVFKSLLNTITWPTTMPKQLVAYSLFSWKKRVKIMVLPTWWTWTLSWWLRTLIRKLALSMRRFMFKTKLGWKTSSSWSVFQMLNILKE